MGDSGHALAAFALGDRMVDGPVVGRAPSHESQVALLHLAELERTHQARGDFSRAGKYQRAARPAIQAMNGVDMFADCVPDAKHRDVVVIGPAAVDEEPGGLVRDHDVIVDVEEVDGRGRHFRERGAGV